MSFRTLIIAMFSISACAAGVKPISLVIDPTSPGSTRDSDLERDREALSNYLKKNPADKETIQDAGNILDAMAADRRGDTEASLQAWSEALRTAKGNFGEKAFLGWVKAYSRKLGKRLEKSELARQILVELNGGQSIPWLIATGLTNEQKLIPFILREAPDAAEGSPSLATEKIDAPSSPGINPSDPLMTNLAGEVCKYKNRLGSGWEKWRSSLNQDVSKYFDSLIAQCSGQSSKAISGLSEVAPRLATNPSTAALALEGFARLIKLRRDQGERESVAPLYIPFMKLWKNPAITEASLGLTRSAYEQRRIEDTFWAARARASIGDGESAKALVVEVLGYVEGVLSQTYSFSVDEKNSLLATAAEGYHFLAFRLAVESKDWDEAVEIAQLALERHNLPNDWRNRIKFSLGFYHYLANEYDQARKVWEELLTDAGDDKIRPSILFWIAQSHQKLGNVSEASFYRKSLSQDYPLSFYAVVALKESNGEFSDAWKTNFNNIQRLNRGLREWQQVDIEDLRADQNRGPLLRRAEVFTALGISQFSYSALEELQKTIDWQRLNDSRHREWGLYISRLYGASGNWYGAISTTTKLSKDPEFWRLHPEQFLLYFPRPFVDKFESIAKEKNLKSEMLMGITRQESSFRVDIRSGANAWGLMQLTPPTAKRLLVNSGFENPSAIKIPENLSSPETNIRLGATFIRELTDRFTGQRPQMFAAYNAGTQTVENWIERRLFDDPLIFIELIPYQETRDYVKGVWRNEEVYRFLAESSGAVPNK